MVDERARREFRAKLAEDLDYARGMLTKIEKLIQEAEDDAELWRQTGDAVAIQEAKEHLADLREEQHARQDEVNRLRSDLAQFDAQHGTR